ncbi:MAG: phospholipase D-like domain-containing protein [archaeon]
MGRRLKRKNWLKSIIFIIIAIALAAIVQDESLADYIRPEKTVTETNIAPEVYFCPLGPCRDMLNRLLESANESIHCAIYDVELVEILETYKEKSASIETKLVTDKDNAKHLSDIEYVANTGTYQLMHNKFCIIDGKIVFTGSYNPTITGMQNDNNMMIIYSKYISDNYEKEFSELYGKEFGGGCDTPNPVVYLNGMKVENYFCPEDGCGEHVMEALMGARESIDFMTFSFTHDGIGDTIVNKHKQGIAVRGVFEKFQNSQWSEYEKLKDEGIDVRFDTNPKNMHNKVFIVDNDTVITGSFNPTKAADTENDENIIIIHDREIAGKYLSEFARIYGG